jgi:hypothetical protein
MLMPQLCRLVVTNNDILSCIASPSQLSDTKIIFTSVYEIKIPNTITVENKDLVVRRMCDTFKDFSNKSYIKFKKTELDTKSQMIIPYFKSSEFYCMRCNKLHNGKSEKCCPLNYSPIKLVKAELYKIVIPNITQINAELERAKSEFLDLHFPDILSTMLLK